MTSSVLDGRVAVDVGEETETETVAVVGGVGKAVDDYAGHRRVEHLAHARVELVVRNVAPVCRLVVLHCRYLTRSVRSRCRRKKVGVEEEIFYDLAVNEGFRHLTEWVFACVVVVHGGRCRRSVHGILIILATSSVRLLGR